MRLTMVARAEKTEANRKRIVEAALELFIEQHYEAVTLATIAEAAGVSHQTVLNHFESKEGVAKAAADLLARQTVDARNKAIPNNIASVVGVLVEDYERIGDANARWAAYSERLGSLATLLDDARAGHQAWLEQMLSDYLPGGRSGRLRAIRALHAATDVYTWKLLRRDLRLGRRETRGIIEDLVRGIVGGDRRARRNDRKPR